MSLVRLLTSGKALTALRDLPSAYRMRRDARLPKFGAGGNPFVDEQASAAGAAVPKAETTAKFASEKRGARSAWNWLGAKKSGVAESLRGLPSQPGAVRSVRTPVQGELLLENVTVRRNDLSDSDVDLVARAVGAEAVRAPATANLLLGAIAAERALDRLAARIVGAGPG
jgi:hypothetical protein